MPINSVFANRMSPESFELIGRSYREVLDFNTNLLATEHVLLGLLSSGVVFPSPLLRQRMDYKEVKALALKIVGRDEIVCSNPNISPRMEQVFDLALSSSIETQSSNIQPGHIAVGLTHCGGKGFDRPAGVADRIMQELGVDREQLGHQVLDIMMREPG